MMKIEKKMMLLVGLLFVTFMTSYAGVPDLKPIDGKVLISGNQLHWSVESTENLNFFIVQRSDNGVNYKPLAMIQVDYSVTEYDFVDEKANNKNWFYRIVNVDFQGVGEYTSAIYLERAFDAANLATAKPPTNITINDHIATEMNCWLNELQFPTISKLGMVAHFSNFPIATELEEKN